MLVYEVVESEQHHVYKSLEISNVLRQYDFLKSTVETAIALNRYCLSHEVIKALNFHAIACLHVSAGEYRPCPVVVGSHQPVDHWQVQSRMNLFVDEVNSAWHQSDAPLLATFVLWKLNHIHPFINGNGRTARAIAYYVLCLKQKGWLPGYPILPELLKINRADYVDALRRVDVSYKAGSLDLSPLLQIVEQLLTQQITSAGI
jgi:Fic/DOC family